MSIYHCSIKIIGRSGGRSAVACAAYRAGEKLCNEETGIMHDYFDDARIVGWTLEGTDDKLNSGLAVLMTVERGGEKKMYVGKNFAGLYFQDALYNVKKKVLIDEDGFGIFKVNDGSVSVYRLAYGQEAPLRNYSENEEEREEQIFRDSREVSAYAEVRDGVEPEIEEESNYKHLEEGVDEALSGDVE